MLGGLHHFASHDSMHRVPPSVPQVVLSTNHAHAGVPDLMDAARHVGGQDIGRDFTISCALTAALRFAPTLDLHATGVIGDVVQTRVSFIVFGAFLIGVDATSIFTGLVPVRFGSGIRLEEQPEMFWLMSAIYLLAGLILVGMGVWRRMKW